MKRLTPSSITLAFVAGAAWVIGLMIEPRRAACAFLFAYIWLASIVVGAPIFLAIAHTTGATWMVVLRRRAEDVASVALALVPLFIPIALTLRFIFPWATPSATWTPALREAIVSKHGYLSTPFFLLRAIVYIASWATVAHVFRRLSRAQDASPAQELVDNQRQFAAATLPWIAFTLTFAAFDWVMSLDPTWSSNVMGIYLFAGGFGGACGLIGVLAFGPFPTRIAVATPQHGYALGRLFLTFVIFWAYIAFSQYLLVWIADLPREVPWMARRTTGAWGWGVCVLVAVHFVVPFGALLSRTLKLHPQWINRLGVWLVVAHAVDVYWLVMPEVAPTPVPSWVDAAALVLVASVAVLMGIARGKGLAGVPLEDPRLTRGLLYEAKS